MQQAEFLSGSIVTYTQCYFYFHHLCYCCYSYGSNIFLSVRVDFNLDLLLISGVEILIWH